MMNVESAFVLEGLPDILVFLDDAESDVFYATARTPCIASDHQGRPELSLILYGRDVGDTFEATGAVLSLTTELAMDPDETKAAVGTLQRLLDAGRGQDDPPAPPPRLSGIAWQSGEVSIAFGDGVVLTSEPTLGGAHRCAFQMKLTAEQASAVDQAWQDGLEGVEIEYTFVTPAEASLSHTEGSSATNVTALIESDGWAEATLTSISAEHRFERPASGGSKFSFSGRTTLAPNALEGTRQTIGLHR